MASNLITLTILKMTKASAVALLRQIRGNQTNTKFVRHLSTKVAYYSTFQFKFFYVN